MLSVHSGETSTETKAKKSDTTGKGSQTTGRKFSGASCSGVCDAEME